MSTTTPRGAEHFNPLAMYDVEEQSTTASPARPVVASSAEQPTLDLQPAPAAAPAADRPAPTRTSVKRPAPTIKPVTAPIPAPAPAPKAGAVPAPGKVPSLAPDAAAVSEPSAPPAKATGKDIHARRRARLKGVAVVLALAAAWVAYTQPWKDIVSTAHAAGPVTLSADATDQVSQDLAYAEQYLASHGTLDGISLTGAQVAVRGQTMYAVRTINGVCTVYGLLNGQRLKPAPDATGGACTGQIVSVQASLDAAANQAQSTSTQAASTTLKQAAATAAAYASRKYMAGHPSMTGLPATIGGAVVTQNTGDYVKLRVSYPSACLEAYVTAAGEIGDINTCS